MGGEDGNDCPGLQSDVRNTVRVSRLSGPLGTSFTYRTRYYGYTRRADTRVRPTSPVSRRNRTRVEGERDDRCDWTRRVRVEPDHRDTDLWVTSPRLILSNPGLKITSPKKPEFSLKPGVPFVRLKDPSSRGLVDKLQLPFEGNRTRSGVS